MLPDDEKDFLEFSKKIRGPDDYCVQQSQEKLNILERENFNLKLKIYNLEHGPPRVVHKISPSDSPEQRKYIKMLNENEDIKRENTRFDGLIKKAKMCIQTLKMQRNDEIKSFKVNLRKLKCDYDALKVRNI